MDTVTIRPGMAIPELADASGKPGWEFAKAHAKDMFALQGAYAVSFTSSAPNDVVIRFKDRDHAVLADNVLQNTIDGANILFETPDKKRHTADGTGAAWAYDVSNMARSVSAMPGVTDYRWNGRSLIFQTESPEHRRFTQPLVNRKLGDIPAYWRGECFGPGCKPQPPHSHPRPV